MKKIIYTSNYFLYALLISAVFFIAVILLFSLNTQPYVRIQTVYAEDAPFSGSGTYDDPYMINDSSDLIELSDLVNNGTKRTDGTMYSALYYKLGNDIDMSGKEFIPIGKEGVSDNLGYYAEVTDVLSKYPLISAYWETYSNYFHTKNENDEYISCSGLEYSEITSFYAYYELETAFYGVFNGAGHKITNLTVSADTDAGLFGYTVNAEIKNLVIENATVSSSSCAGAIAGRTLSSSVNNCAVISASISASSSSGNAYAGGISGYSGNKTYYFEIGEVLDYDITNEATPFCNSPKTDSFFSCVVLDGVSVSSSGISGGIAAEISSGTVKDIFSSASLTSQSDKKGSIFGAVSSENVSVYNCIGTSCKLFGSLSETPPTISNCLYPVDIISDDSYKDLIGYTADTYGLITLETGENTSFTSWYSFSVDGSDFYYPSPIKNYKQKVEVLSVKLDAELVFLVNKDAADKSFTLPEPLQKDGYDFAYFLINNKTKAESGTGIDIDSNTDIETYYSAVPPSKSNINIDSELTYVYNGSEQTVATAAYTDEFNRNFTYQWYKNETPVSENETLSLTHVNESGEYFCRITVTGSDESLNLVSSVYVDSDVINISVTPLTLELSVSATINGNNEVTFNDSVFTPDCSYTCDGIIQSDKEEIENSLTYVVYFNGEQTESVFNAGTYVIDADISHTDYIFNTVPCELTVNKADITANVTGFNGAYDGNAHSVKVSVTTVGNRGYKLAYSLDNSVFSSEKPVFTSVISETTIYIRITADNHNDLILTSSITINPIKVTVSAKDTYPEISKVYDSTTEFEINSVTEEHFSVIYSDNYTGISPVKVESVTSSSANSGDVTLTVSFSLSNNNFIFNDNINTVILNGTIEKATVWAEQNGIISSTYKGGTNYTSAVGRENYTVRSDSVAVPSLTVYSAFTDSPDVETASSVTVKFVLSGLNYVFYNGTGEYVFDFTLLPKELTVDTDYIYAQNRPYDGTTAVELVVSDGFVSGIVPGDSLSLIFTATVPSPDASTQYVSVSSAAVDSSNYTLPDNTASLITEKDLSVTISRANPIFEVKTSSSVIYSSASALPSISYESDIRGEIKWKDVFLTPDEKIDWSKYSVSADGTVSFGYIFTPSDLKNYTTSEGYFQFIKEDVTASGLRIQYSGKTSFIAFEKVDISNLEVVLLLTDGTETILSYGSNGYNIIYPDGNDSFNAGNTYFEIIYYSENSPLSEQIPVTVEKIILPVPVAASSFVYNGNPKTFIPDGFDSDLMTLADNVKTDAGTYVSRVSLLPSATGNYRFDNDNLTFADIEWVISPIKKYSPFLEKSSFVYSGENIEPVLRNDYNSTNDFFTISGDTSAVNAGSYTLTVTLVSSNYYWIETDNSLPLKINWKISPCSVPVPEIYNLPFTYDGQSHTVSLTENSACSFSGDLEWTNASDYVIYADLIDTVNYVWDNGTSDTVTLNYTVNKVVVTKPVVTTSFVYNGQAFSIGLNSSSQNYVISGTSRAVNAGYYTATVSLPDQTNYIWSDDTVIPYEIDWRISPLSIKLPSVAGTAGYTGKEQTALISADSKYCTVTGNKAVNAGSYTATISLSDKKNTLWADGTTENITLIWKISPDIVNVPSSPQNVFYTGLPQTASIPLNSAYSVSGNTQTSAGTYTISVSLIDKNNYVWDNGKTDDLSFIWNIFTISLVTDDNNKELLSSYLPGTPLSVPYRDGYSFGGWYLSSDFSGEPVDTILSADSNLTLYAKWTEISSSSGNENPPAESPLSDKAIIGLAVGGGALLIAVLIVILGFVLKRGGSHKKNKPTGRPDLF